MQVLNQPDLFEAQAPGAPRAFTIPYQRRSSTSRAASETVRPVARSHESDVYDTIVAAGARGVTRKELSHLCGFAEGQQNRITGRVASLLAKGVIRETDERRDGSKVLVATGARP